VTQPLFLIGAGFNADAAQEVGPVHGTSIYIGGYQIDCGYPLVLMQLAFASDWRRFRATSPSTGIVT